MLSKNRPSTYNIYAFGVAKQNLALFLNSEAILPILKVWRKVSVRLRVLPKRCFGSVSSFESNFSGLEKKVKTDESEKSARTLPCGFLFG